MLLIVKLIKLNEVMMWWYWCPKNGKTSFLIKINKIGRTHESSINANRIWAIWIKWKSGCLNKSEIYRKRINLGSWFWSVITDEEELHLRRNEELLWLSLLDDVRLEPPLIRALSSPPARMYLSTWTRRCQLEFKITRSSILRFHAATIT